MGWSLFMAVWVAREVEFQMGIVLDSYDVLPHSFLCPSVTQGARQVRKGK